MAVTRVSVTNNAPASAGNYTLALPSGYQAGDRLLAFVAGKYDTTTIPTINQGWTLLKSGTGGTGSTGNDTGLVFWAVYGKDATSSSETAPTITVGATAPNSFESFTVAYRPSMGATWTDAITTSASYVQSASDTNTASTLTGTTGAFTNQPTAGDAIAAFGVIPTDLGTALGATTITATGLSGGTVTTTSGYVENGLGQDSASVFADWTGFTGTQSAGTAISFTITSSTNHSGVVVAVALRETVDPNSAQLVASTRSGASDANGTSNTIAVPSGAASGMVAILGIEIFLDSGSAPITATWPSGFTEIVDERSSLTSGNQLLIAKKTLTGSDGGNYVTNFSAARWNASMCALVSNAGSVITPDSSSVDSATTGTSIGTLSLTSSGKPLLLHFQANPSGGTTHTPPTGFTELWENEYLTLAARAPLTTGSHSSSGATQSSSQAWAAALIGVEPATGDAAITPQATTVSVTAGSLTVRREEQITPAAVTITVGAGSLVVRREEQVAPAAVSVSVSPGSLSVAQGIAPAAVTVSVSPGSLTVEPGPVGITPAATTVSVTPGTLAVGQAVSLTGPTVSVTPGTLSLALSITPSATTVSVTPGSLTVSQQAAGEITPQATTVSVTPGTLVVRREEQITPAATTVSVTPGSVTVVRAQAITPAAVTVSITPGSLSVAPGPVSITPQATSVSVTAGSLSVALSITPTAPTVTVTPGTLAVTRGPVGISPAAATVNVMAGTLTISGGVVQISAPMRTRTGAQSTRVSTGDPLTRVSTGRQATRVSTGLG